MKQTTKSFSTLGTYLTVGLGAGCLSGQVDAATVVSLYGPGARTTSSTIATPAGISMTTTSSYGSSTQTVLGSGGVMFANSIGVFFTRGTDLSSPGSSNNGIYKTSNAIAGALFNSNQNYINISFGIDSTYEAVGQFYLNGTGTGYLVALAKNSDGSALSISAGKLAIDNYSAVPEPSSLGLLAMGATGLLLRRRRKVA